jgi:hypothetical protein
MRRRRHRSSTQNHRRRALVVLLGCVGLAIALVAVALTLPPRSDAPVVSGENDAPVSFGAAPLDDAPFTADLVGDSSDAYPIYRYSVVAGGVHSLKDVERAVESDPTVRAHYSSVSIANLKVVHAPARREAYMSYRIGDRVYWTSKKIALAQGEAVLTDGRTTIRARCGNLVSDVAMSPTSGEEPPSSAFDAVEPRPGIDGAASEPTAVAGISEDRAPGSGPAGGDSAPGEEPSGVPGAGGFAPGGFGGGLVSPGGRTSSAPPGGPGGSLITPGPNPPSGGTPPGGGTPPDGEIPPDVWNPPGDGNPGFPPGFEEEPNPPGGPGNPPGTEIPPIDIETPPQVLPVPEPGTLVLLGTGLALTAWRARRRQSTRKDS